MSSSLTTPSTTADFIACAKTLCTLIEQGKISEAKALCKKMDLMGLQPPSEAEQEAWSIADGIYRKAVLTL